MPISTLIKVSTSRIVIETHPLARERLNRLAALYSTHIGSIAYLSGNVNDVGIIFVLIEKSLGLSVTAYLCDQNRELCESLEKNLHKY